MNLEELKRWIVDTISEGGYSFKELYEYILNSGISFDDFYNQLKLATEERLITIYISAPHSEEKIFLDQSNQKETLENYVNVVNLESKIGSRHYFDLTKNGSKYLNYELR